MKTTKISQVCTAKAYPSINVLPGMKVKQVSSTTHGSSFATRIGLARSRMSMSGSSARPRPSSTNIAKTTALKADSSRTLCLSSTPSTCCSNTPTSTCNNQQWLIIIVSTPTTFPPAISNLAQMFLL